MSLLCGQECCVKAETIIAKIDASDYRCCVARSDFCGFKAGWRNPGKLMNVNSGFNFKFSKFVGE
jgi:hypothetical protein